MEGRGNEYRSQYTELYGSKPAQGPANSKVKPLVLKMIDTNEYGKRNKDEYKNRSFEVHNDLAQWHRNERRGHMKRNVRRTTDSHFDRHMYTRSKQTDLKTNKKSKNRIVFTRDEREPEQTYIGEGVRD